MKRLIHILSAIWLLTLASCQPNELPVSHEAEPEYTLEGTFGGNPFTLAVGPDNVFVESDSNTAEDEIPTFSAEINGEECSNCFGSLEFVISGNQEYNQDMQFEELITSGDYQFIDPYGTNDNLISILDYSLSDIFSVIVDGIETEELVFDFEPGEHSITLFQLEEVNQIIVSNQYSSSFNVGEEGEICFEQTTISEQNGLLEIQIPEQYEESVLQVIVNDQSLDLNNLIIDLVDFNVDSINPLSFTINYSENNCINNETFSWFGSANDYLNIELGISNILETSPILPSTVSLVYTNSEGLVYTSSLMNSENDWFEITDIQPADFAGGNIFNITFSCLVTLENEEDPSDSVELSLENALIPLVFN